MRNKFYRVLNELLFNSFQGLMLSGFSNNLIVMYHGVDLSGNTRFNMRHAGVKCFEKHIGFLKKYCNVIPLADFFQEKFQPRKINIAITFDDGYQNNYKYALPVLEKYQTPASWFITGLNKTEFKAIWADVLNIAEKLVDEPILIDDDLFVHGDGGYRSVSTGITLFETVKKHKPGFEFKQKMIKKLMDGTGLMLRKDLEDYWKLMTDEQIKACAKSKYIEIGSHGVFHNNLGNIPLQEANEELKQSKSYLENLTQKEVLSLAYPDGSYTIEVKSLAALVGIKYQLAADGFLFPEDRDDSRIRDRAGIYTCGRCGNQLFDALKKRV